MTLEQQDLGKKSEESRTKLKEKMKNITVHKPLPGTGLHVDPRQMEQLFESHRSSDGTPPLRGARDD